MLDVVLVVGSVALVALSMAYAAFCDRLGEDEGRRGH